MSVACKRILCALDTPNLETATALASSLKDEVAGLKLGLEFFTRHGPDGYRAVATCGAPIFLDLKLHDIPNTVAGAVRSVAPLRPFMLTVHTQGGETMMRAAQEAALEAAGKGGFKAPLIIGVTVLTSLDGGDLNAIGVAGESGDQVLRLSDLACRAGLDGVVCSPHEITALRKSFGQDLRLIVPGIRPEGGELGDQKRVLSPRQAADAGADYLVIGRPITEALDSLAAIVAINRSLAS
jgi:orotidine-5'-phosphate decarboxylase